jgi:hypothetical protein
MLAAMTTACAYCDHPATATIVAIPERVCADHLREFWIGLLDYSHRRSAPCVKSSRWCPCIACEAERLTPVRTYAPKRGRMLKRDDEAMPMRLAS